MRVAVHPPPGSESVTTRWAEGHSSAGVDLVGLTPRTAMSSDVDIAHIHWPEHLFRSSQRPLAKIAWGSIVVAALSIRRTPVVLTLHNDVPHGGWRSRIERMLVRVVRRQALAVVTLVPSHDSLVRSEAGYDQPIIRTVPLGSLATTEPAPSKPSGPIHLVQVGAIAPYKGQLETISALKKQLDSGDVRLDIVGRSIDDDYTALVRDAIAETPNASLSDGWVEDSELGKLICDADAVIGCQSVGLNTGVIYASVPVGTPTVCSDTSQARDEQQRLGKDWILILTDPTSPAEWRQLVASLNARREETTSVPVAFDWHGSGIAHRDLYQDALLRSQRRLEFRRS